MIDDLDYMRRKLAEIRYALQTAELLVEMSPGEDSTGFAEARAIALAELRLASDSAEKLVAELDNILAPTRH